MSERIIMERIPLRGLPFTDDATLENDEQKAAPHDGLDDEAEEAEGGDHFQDVVWLTRLLQLLLLLTCLTYKHKLADKKASWWRPLRWWQTVIMIVGVSWSSYCE